jgi:thymidylate synthase ThyX
MALSAQWEIRELARKMLQEARKVAPLMFEHIE